MEKKIIILIGMLIVLSLGLVSAHEHNVEEIKELINSKISCDKLTDEQLETIGDYYMEQMHPGEAHKAMDEMMGGEGSESLKQMHINMAKMMYCGESENMMNGGMMSGSGNMMGGNMMGMMPMMMNMMGSNMMNSGMMGSNMIGSSIGTGSWWLWNIIGILFWVVLFVALILLIIWLYKKIIREPIEDESAFEILKRRFAKGEITKKQFEEMKKEL